MKSTISPPGETSPSQSLEIDDPLGIHTPITSFRALLHKPLPRDHALPIPIAVHRLLHHARLVPVILRPRKRAQHHHLARELLEGGPSDVPLGELVMAEVEIVVIRGGGALGRSTRALDGGAEGVRGAVGEGGDAGVFVRVDDSPGYGAAAVKVVQGIGAEGGNAEGAGDAGVGGEVDVGFRADSREDVPFQGGELGITELEFDTELVGRWRRRVSEGCGRREGRIGLAFIVGGSRHHLVTTGEREHLFLRPFTPRGQFAVVTKLFIMSVTFCGIV